MSAQGSDQDPRLGSAAPSDDVGRSAPAGPARAAELGRGDMVTVDLSDLQSVLDAAREGDEAAGDPLGEDTVMAALSDAGQRWSAAEMAGAVAEGMAPGQALGNWIACLAPGQLSDYALPGAAAACRRLASWAQAAELELVAEVAARAAVRDSAVPVGQGGIPAAVPAEAAAEVALALRMSHHGASSWTQLAITLAGRLTGTGAALRAGQIDLSRARLMAEATGVLDDRGAATAEAKVLPAAGTKTMAQLRAALHRAVITVDPAAAERRREDAERRAKVGLYGDEDGTATLSGQNLPGAHAAAAMARVTALARALKSSGAGGGIDLLRAQVYIGLLLGTLPLIPPADNAPPDGPGGPGGAGGTAGSDSPDASDGPGACDGPGASDGPGVPGEPGDGGSPAAPASTDGTGAGNSDDPNVRDPDDPGPSGPDDLDDPGDPDGPDCPGSCCAPEDLSEPGDLGGPDGPGLAQIPAWPELPVPRQAPAGLVPAGTGALAGLPRGPAGRLLHLTVPWRTLAGILAEPGQLSRLGPVTAHTARHLAGIAADDPETEWKVIVTDRNGQAIAATRIRRRARSPAVAPAPAAGLVSQVILTVPAFLARSYPIQQPFAGSSAVPGEARAAAEPATSYGSGPSSESPLGRILAAALSAAALAAARAEAETAEAASQGTSGCAHRKSSPAYRPPARLREFVVARDQTCRSPVCRQPAGRADLDHTVPHDQGGRTCDCNLGGACRTHHRIKQRSGWQLAQPAPGIFIWTTPAGRAYTQRPDTYPA